MINKHGMKIIGIRKASGETEDYGDFSGKYVEIFYDTSSGEVWTKFQYSLGGNSWTEYHDPYVIKICDTARHMKMQEIADKILTRMVEYYAQPERKAVTDHNI